MRQWAELFHWALSRHCLKVCGVMSRRVRWAPDGRSLASASDDRTLRLWELPAEDSSTSAKPGSAPAAAELAATQVSFGHGSRLWDVQYCGGGGLIATASEDCTCRRAPSPIHNQTVNLSCWQAACLVILTGPGCQG